jgi:hypothetical protein
MTTAEKMELCDNLDAVSFALTKAKYLYDEIKTAYFDKYDPTMNGKADCATGLVYEHPRYTTFLDMLGDYLHEIEAHIPSTGWINAQPITEEATKA